MVVESRMPGLELAPDDVARLRLRCDGWPRSLGEQDMLEYWRSSPYVLELMDGYVVKKELERAGADNADVVAAVRAAHEAAEQGAGQRLRPGRPRQRQDARAHRGRARPRRLPARVDPAVAALLRAVGRLCRGGAAPLHQAAGLLGVERRAEGDLVGAQL